MVRQIAAHFQEVPRTVLEERVHKLETTVATLSEALRVLARGLEGGPLSGPGEQKAADAARRASEMLLSTEVAEVAEPAQRARPRRVGEGSR